MFEWIIFEIRIRWKKYQADFLHKTTGRKYHVVKLYGQLIVTNRLGIKRLKQKKILNKDFDYMKLSEISVYETK